MSVASFVAAQRAEHGVPHALTCRTLEISESWFYKWRDRPPTPRQVRQAELTAAIEAVFDDTDGTYGSPRVTVELREQGWKVSKNTVAKMMACEGLVARPKKRRRGLTRPDKGARRAPDLLGRDFSASAPNVKWCGDFKEIDTGEGPLYLASVEDLFSRRLLGFAMSQHYPDAELAKAAIHMAVAIRGGDVTGVIFHTDQGSQYTSDAFAAACAALEIRQSMGRAGSALDNAVAESFFSTLEHELLSRRKYATRAEARRGVARWIDEFYNARRRHSTCDMMSPVAYEHAHAVKLAQEAA
jgi:transposase InsO family protein